MNDGSLSECSIAWTRKAAAPRIPVQEDTRSSQHAQQNLRRLGLRRAKAFE